MNNIVEKSVLDGTSMLNVKRLGRWIDETNERLTAVEKKVENNVSVEFKPERVVFGCSYNRDIGFSAEVVDQKLYDKLEAKHEADCRLISEYDLEIKRLERVVKESEFHINKLKEDLERWVKRYKELDYIYEKKNEENSRLKDRYKSKIFVLNNVENERNHYKGLYSSKCEDYDKLLEKKIENEKTAMEEVAKYKNLFHSLNHKHQKVVGEMKNWKDKYECLNDDYNGLEIEYNKLIKENKTFNVLLINKTETIGKLGAEYDNLKEQNNKLLKDYKLLSESNNNHAADNIELEGKLEEKTLRIAALEEKLRNQRTNLSSLQEKYEDALKMNKAREDVYYQNQKLAEIIKAKNREIDLLRAELDKFMSNEDNNYDDRWID